MHETSRTVIYCGRRAAFICKICADLRRPACTRSHNVREFTLYARCNGKAARRDDRLIQLADTKRKATRGSSIPLHHFSPITCSNIYKGSCCMSKSRYTEEDRSSRWLEARFANCLSFEVLLDEPFREWWLLANGTQWWARVHRYVLYE